MENKFVVILIFLLSIVSCERNKKEILDLYGCYEANVYKITGNNRYIRFNSDVKIYFTITQNNFLYRGILLIEPNLFSEAFVPFKKGDIVLLKVLGEIDNTNVTEAYLFERPKNSWKSVYTLEDICENNSKEFSKRKALFIKGKIIRIE